MNLVVDGNKHTLFYDTYALYAIARGEQNYFSYASGHRIITTMMNLYELYYILHKEGQPELAEAFFNRLLSACVEILPEDIKKASHLRMLYSKKKWSYIDVLGYAIAGNRGVRFLTGDKRFENVQGVLCVK